MISRTSSSRISAAVPGNVESPASFASGQVLTEVHAEPAGAFGHLERGEAVDVDVRRDLLHGPRDVEVVVAVEVRVDAALQADLRRAAVDRLEHPPLDLLDPEQVRVAPQVERELVPSRTRRTGT